MMSHKVVVIALFFIIGAFFSGLFFRWYYQFPNQVDGFDHNSDGILDEKYIRSKSGNLLFLKSDRNFDGKIDLSMEFAPTGHIVKAKSDDDFNESFETMVDFVNNQTSAVRVDTDGDGLYDLIQLFEHGVSKEASLIDREANAIVKRYYYELGKPIKSYEDNDLDGVFETECRFDFLENKKCKAKLESDKH